MLGLNTYVILGAIGFWLVTLGGGMIWAHQDGAARNEAKHVALDLENTRKTLDDFVDATKNMHGLADQFSGIGQTLSTEVNDLSRKFRNGIKAAPLPVDCRPDPFRVQSLSAAIAAANTAIGRGALPAVPPAH